MVSIKEKVRSQTCAFKIGDVVELFQKDIRIGTPKLEEGKPYMLRVVRYQTNQTGTEKVIFRYYLYAN
jgi:hypothetical protein